MKQSKSFGNLSGETNHKSYLSTEDRKMNSSLGNSRRAGQKWRSLVELSSSARILRNGKTDCDGNAASRESSLMAREVERLQRLKLNVLRANDERRKSYAGFEHKQRPQRRLSADWRETATASPSAENRETLQLPRIKRLTEQTRPAAPSKRQGDNRGEQAVDENGKNFEKNQDKEKFEDVRYGSPLPFRAGVQPQDKTRKPSIGPQITVSGTVDQTKVKDSVRYGSPLPFRAGAPSSQDKTRKHSIGPQITVSGTANLNSKVKDFVQRSQPGPSETSLRMARKMTKKLPSMKSNDIKQRSNGKLDQQAQQIIVNTDTCPPISFYEDRSWYYQDKRGKCRYLRIPDSPVPPITSVFDKD